MEVPEEDIPDAVCGLLGFFRVVHVETTHIRWVGHRGGRDDVMEFWYVAVRVEAEGRQRCSFWELEKSPVCRGV